MLTILPLGKALLSHLLLPDPQMKMQTCFQEMFLNLPMLYAQLEFTLSYTVRYRPKSSLTVGLTV